MYNQLTHTHTHIYIYIYIYIYINETTRHLKESYISILTNLLQVRRRFVRIELRRNFKCIVVSLIFSDIFIYKGT